MGGADIYEIPRYFVSYSSVQKEVGSQALSPQQFSRIHGGNVAKLKKLLTDKAFSEDEYGILPVVIGRKFGIAVIHRNDGLIASFEFI